MEGESRDHDRLLKAPENKALSSSDSAVIVNLSATDKQLAELDRTNKSSGSLTELNFRSQGLTREQIAARLEEQDESVSIDYGDGRDASRKSGLTEKDLLSVGRKSYEANTVLAYNNRQSSLASDTTSATAQEQNKNKNGNPYSVYSLEASQATRKLDPISPALTQGNYQESVKLNVQITNAPEVSPGVKPEELLDFTNAVMNAGAKVVRPVEEHLAKPNAINNDLWNLPSGAANAVWHFAQSPEQLNKDTAAIASKVLETIDKPMMPEQRAVAAGSLLPMFFFEGGKPLDNAAAKQMNLDQMTAPELKLLGIERKERYMSQIPPSMRHLELTKAGPELLDAMSRKGREFQLFEPDSFMANRMEKLGAEASVFALEGETDIIFLKAKAPKIAALEEFLHGTQKRIPSLANELDVILEIEVKDFMIRHRQLLGLSDNDLKVLEVLKQEEIEKASLEGLRWLPW